ncbi:uncharacterized protein LOC129587891 isoform X2 [Paramacrobiotus metropolitanus]|uniref:uncharacterized protein LOC129587891 isoform X2 n=1 Tax=Paramacrobiotus metropolitanus TaxID=2943436 RepID=UPI002445A3A5|nr:uncharacterized protein LOC129587891 isoform X2 [Paramacrobiotus metropolitanus]
MCQLVLGITLFLFAGNYIIPGRSLLLQPNGRLQYMDSHQSKTSSISNFLPLSSLPRPADKRLSYAFDRILNMETADECVQNEDCLGGQCVQDSNKGHRVCACLRDSFRYSIANGLDVCLKCRNLSNSCSFDDECQCWDKHAECKIIGNQSKGHCRCRSAYVPVLNQTTNDVTCVRRGGINSICESDDECQHISFLDAAGNPLPPFFVPTVRVLHRPTTSTTTTTTTTTTTPPIRVVPDSYAAVCVPVIDVAEAPGQDREELGQPILIAPDEHVNPAKPTGSPATTPKPHGQRILPDPEVASVNDSSSTWDGDFMMSEGADSGAKTVTPSIILRTRLLYKRQVQAAVANPGEVQRSQVVQNNPDPMEKTCQCPDGFQMVPGNEYMCQDIDECSDLFPDSGLDPCNPLRVAHSASVCVNTPGSYRCECNATFAISNGMPPSGICCEDGYIPCLDATKCVPLENLCDGVPNCATDCSDELYPFCNFNTRRPFPDLTRYPQCHEPDLEIPQRFEPEAAPIPVPVPGRGTVLTDSRQEDNIPLSATKTEQTHHFSLPGTDIIDIQTQDSTADPQLEGPGVFAEGSMLDSVFQAEAKENVTTLPSTARPVPSTPISKVKVTSPKPDDISENDVHTLPPTSLNVSKTSTTATPISATKIPGNGNGRVTMASSVPPTRATTPPRSTRTTTVPTIFTTVGVTTNTVPSKAQTANDTADGQPTKVTPCDRNTTATMQATITPTTTKKPTPPAVIVSADSPTVAVKPALISPSQGHIKPHSAAHPPRRIQGNLQAALASALSSKAIGINPVGAAPSKSNRPSPMVALANSLGDIDQIEPSFAVVPVIQESIGSATLTPSERDQLKPLKPRDEEQSPDRPPNPLPTLPANITAALFLGYTLI